MTIRIVHKVKRIALYVRLSTTGKGQDPETQLMPMREWVAQRDYVVFREYLDLGWSGIKEQRPALNLMMKDAREGRFDMVVVARFDRFARSTKHLLTALSEFQSLRIDFISLNEAIDTSTPMGRMVFTIIGAMAELERNLIRERVIAGVNRARKQGKHLGRPRAVFDEACAIAQVQAGESLHSVSKRWQVSRGVIRRLIAKDQVRKPVAEAVQSPVPLVG